MSYPTDYYKFSIMSDSDMSTVKTFADGFSPDPRGDLRIKSFYDNFSLSVSGFDSDLTSKANEYFPDTDNVMYGNKYMKHPPGARSFPTIDTIDNPDCTVTSITCTYRAADAAVLDSSGHLLKFYTSDPQTNGATYNTMDIAEGETIMIDPNTPYAWNEVLGEFHVYMNWFKNSS